MRISSRGTLNRKPAGQPDSGFTLLEIVIVVSVLALFVGLAVPRLPDMAGTRIHRNARKISMALQLARSRAISLRRYYRVEVDLNQGSVSASYFGPEGTYIPDDEIRRTTLSDATILDVVNASDGKVLEGTAWVRISPRGFIEPAHIHIADQRERVLTIAPYAASGRVQIHEGYVDLSVK